MGPYKFVQMHGLHKNCRKQIIITFDLI